MRSNYSPKEVELEDIHQTTSSNAFFPAKLNSHTSLKSPPCHTSSQEEKTPENQHGTTVAAINAKINLLEKSTGSQHAIVQWRTFYSKGSPSIDTTEFKTRWLEKLGDRAKEKNVHQLFLEITKLINEHNNHIKKNHAHFQHRLFNHFREIEQLKSSEPGDEELLERRALASFK
jgi:hypothetical protein